MTYVAVNIYTAHNKFIEESIMQKMKSWKQIAIVCCAVSLLTACGQKGDLYLPEGKAIIAWMV